jgi:hypothetical protein
LAAPYPGASPILLSPAELHRYLLRIQRRRNRLHWRFLEGLLALDRGEAYRALGYSSTRQYAEKHFGLGRTAVHEALRVAAIFRELPATRIAFVNGLAYGRVKEITRVASAENEREWISLAGEVSIHKLKVEVEDALKKNQKKPRAKDAL